MTLSRNSNFLFQNEINSQLQVVTSICEEKSLFSYDCEFISHNFDYFIRIAKYRLAVVSYKVWTAGYKLVVFFTAQNFLFSEINKYIFHLVWLYVYSGFAKSCYWKMGQLKLYWKTKLKNQGGGNSVLVQKKATSTYLNLRFKILKKMVVNETNLTQKSLVNFI